MSVTAFLTDSTLCIGCKACEVACKEWNGVSEDGLDWSGFSYDNTGAVGASTWRHVKFVEQAPIPGIGGNAGQQNSWGFSSDVCKHCENAGCLEACPTGSIVRTEFGGVFIQPDVCNGCGYCVTSCPFGVVERNPKDGRAFALFAMTARRSGWNLRVRKHARPSPSSSGRSNKSARPLKNAWTNSIAVEWKMRCCMILRVPASAEHTRCSLFAATRVLTICLLARRCRLFT
jgi:Fe-S-cluster-containing dehydrogenase component